MKANTVHYSETVLQRIKAFLAVICFTHIPLSEASNFQIDFGLLGKSDRGYFIQKQTNKIPYVTKEQGQIFGVVVKPESEEEYKVYLISYLPKLPSKLSGDARLLSTHESVTVVSSPVQKTIGAGVHHMWLDEGDPIGKYKVEIYINDELAKAIEFEVVK